MKVTGVRLQNFLSYPAGSAVFDDGLNLITGENAAGKTNLIDSIYFASVGRSARFSKDKDLLRWETETGARVTLNIAKRFSKHEIDIYIDTLGKKRVTVDGLPIQKIGELMGVLNVVFFSPNELKLVKESPADRRRFLDISLSQQSKTYFYALQKYNKLLVQRNKLLKSYKGRPALKDMLNLTDPELVRTGAFILEERGKFIKKLLPLAKEEHSKITGGKEELRLTYESEPVDADNIAGSLERLLAEALPADERLEYTTVGVHRDDMKIAANGVDLRRFGSQGQQRSAVLSLKLAEISLFQERTGETPVLILDDVLSELDTARRAALIEALEGMQTLVTCTEPPADLSARARILVIKDRNIRTVTK